MSAEPEPRTGPVPPPVPEALRRRERGRVPGMRDGRRRAAGGRKIVFRQRTPVAGD